MSLGDDLRDQVSDLLFDVQAQVTELLGIKDSAKRTGEELLAVKSHNQNVIISGGKLTVAVPEIIDRIVTEYRIVIQSLENYRSNTE